MSSVLYDYPGPRARRRTLIYSLIGTVVVVALLSLSITHIPQTERKPILQDLKGGVTYVRGQPAIVALTVLAFLTTFLGLPLTVLPVGVTGLEAELGALLTAEPAGQDR